MCRFGNAGLRARAYGRRRLVGPEANPLGQFRARGAEASGSPVPERGAAATGPPMARARQVGR
eukprot:2094146-Alexandrium_andersonii.AAC.1